jgi:hypothetical protein
MFISKYSLFHRRYRIIREYRGKENSEKYNQVGEGIHYYYYYHHHHHHTVTTTTTTTTRTRRGI